MTFKASLREIDNGFIVETTLPGELYHRETYEATILEALATILLTHSKWYPAATPATPSGALKELSDGAIRFSKISGLVSKDFSDFLTAFIANFPGENVQAALEAAHCKVVEGKVVFVGG